MPFQESSFVVPRTVDDVWSVIADRNIMGSLFPGFRRVTILNDSDSIWTVQFSFGPFSRTIDITTHNTEFRERETLAWTSQAEGFSGGGRVSLKTVPGGTEVSVRMEIHSIGPLPFFHNIVVAERLGSVTREFVRNLKNRLAPPADSRLPSRG